MITVEKLIRNKPGLLQLASCLNNVSEACRIMGCSRDTFYPFTQAFDESDVDALKFFLAPDYCRTQRDLYMLGEACDRIVCEKLITL